jgi:hypothetical protein
VFNGDVFTSVDLPAVLALHRERKARATIVLTPVDDPMAYGLVETDPQGNVARFVEKPTPDQIRCDTINAGSTCWIPGTFDRIPRTWRTRSSADTFPSLIEPRDVRRATSIAGTGSTSARRRSTARRIATSWTAGSSRRRSPGRRGDRSRPTRGSKRARRSTALLHRRGRVVKSGARIGPYTVHRPRTARREKRRRRRRDSLAERWVDAEAHLGADRRPPLPLRPQRRDRRSAVYGDQIGVTDYSQARPWPARPSDPSRDLQGVRRSAALSAGVTEDRRAAIGARSWRISSAKRIAVSRDMRRVVAVAGGGVHRRAPASRAPTSCRYGLCGTDMLYFAGRPRPARRRRADHRVAQSEAVQRHQDGPPRGAFPLSATRASATSAT